MTSETWRRRLDPEARYGLRLSLLLLATLILAVPFGLLLREVTQQGPLTELDTSAANTLHGFVRERAWLVDVLTVVTSLGSPVWFYVLVGGAALYMWGRGQPRIALFLVFTGLLGGLLNSSVKELVDRPRPSLVAPVATARGKSFPSGHAMAATVNYGALLLAFLPLMGRRLRPLAWGIAIGLVLAIGFTRLALGVHYITDVLGGYALGLAWLAASTAAFGIWRVERREEAIDVSEGLTPENPESQRQAPGDRS